MNLIRFRRAGRRANIALLVSLLTAALAIGGAQRGTSAAPSPDGTAPSTPSAPDAACADPSGQCFEDVPSGNAFYEFANSLFRDDVITGYACGGVGEPCVAPYNKPYYRPGAGVTRQQMAKFVDQARHLPGISIDTATHPAPISVRTTAAGAIAIEGMAGGGGFGMHGISQTGIGVLGQSTSGPGVQGESNTANGVSGISVSAVGVYGESAWRAIEGYSTGGTGIVGSSGSGVGMMALSQSSTGMTAQSYTGIAISGLASGTEPAVRAVNNSNGPGLEAVSAASDGIYATSLSGAWAGNFQGNVQVTGNIAKGGGSFKIDHPLDPQNKYLYHSFVESPDMMNVYNGNITTDANGEAVVQLPDWFETLNEDFRYQLTSIGQFAQVIVLHKIEDNRFTIKTDRPNVEISWQVTGIRHDPYANAHRIPVEESKPADAQGKYLHPDVYGQPNVKGESPALTKSPPLMHP